MIKGFILPYLGQQDDALPLRPRDHPRGEMAPVLRKKSIRPPRVPLTSIDGNSDPGQPDWLEQATPLGRPGVRSFSSQAVAAQENQPS